MDVRVTAATWRDGIRKSVSVDVDVAEVGKLANALAATVSEHWTLTVRKPLNTAWTAAGVMMRLEVAHAVPLPKM